MQDVTAEAGSGLLGLGGHLGVPPEDRAGQKGLGGDISGSNSPLHLPPTPCGHRPVPLPPGEAGNGRGGAKEGGKGEGFSIFPPSSVAAPRARRHSAGSWGSPGSRPAPGEAAVWEPLAAVIYTAQPHKLPGRSPREPSLTATSRARCQNLKHFQPLIEEGKKKIKKKVKGGWGGGGEISARGVGIKPWLCNEESPASCSQDPDAPGGHQTRMGSGERDF